MIMNLIVLIGSGAVGKMTVGQELMKITNYRLFHNHHMIEPVLEIFGKFDCSYITLATSTKNYEEILKFYTKMVGMTFHSAFLIKNTKDIK